jgi:hypothetical protein
MINPLVTEFHEKVVKHSVHEFNSSVTNIKKKTLLVIESVS